MKKTIKTKAVIKPKTYLVLIGLMMIFILLDAFIQGSKDQIFFKFFLSIFTIPLFIGFVGYAHDYQAMSSLTWIDWLKRYALKPLVAYVIAVIIYTFLIYANLISTYGLGTYLTTYYPSYLLRHSYDAFFRLSFLIAIPFYSLVLYLFVRYTKQMKTYLYVVLGISLVSLIILLMPQTFRSVFGMLYVFMVEKNLMLYNMIFFAAGTLLRHHSFKLEYFDKPILIRNGTYTIFVLLITSLFFLLNRSDYFITGNQSTQSLILAIQTLIIYLFNLALLVQLSIALKKDWIKPVPGLMYMGSIYQGILIWYGLIIFAAYRLAGASIVTYDFTRYYWLVILFTSIFVALIYVFRKHHFIKTYLLLEMPHAS